MKEDILFSKVVITEDWRKLYNEELYNSFCLPDIPRVITSRRMISGAGYWDTWGSE
jgi:hypothetical protein